MTVRALLDGDQVDLQALVDLFPGGDPRVVRGQDDDERIYLESSELDPLFDNAPAMHDAAVAILVRLMGAARAADEGFRLVRAVGRYDRPGETMIYSTDEGRGGDSVHVVAVATAEIRLSARAEAIAVNGEPASAEPRGSRYLEFAATHTDLAELFDLFGKADSLTWIELFKAYEIIKNAVSGGRNGNQMLAARLDVTEPDIKAFTVSANRPDVSGAGARHARMSGGPPSRSMTLPEGRSFIRDLIARWIEVIS